jgi:hypothetical protein
MHIQLCSNLKGKKPLETPRRRCEDIRMDLRKIGYEDVDWMHLAQNREQRRALLNTLMNLRAQ